MSNPIVTITRADGRQLVIPRESLIKMRSCLTLGVYVQVASFGHEVEFEDVVADLDSPGVITVHLSRLITLGLVTQRIDGDDTFYRAEGLEVIA